MQGSKRRRPASRVTRPVFVAAACAIALATVSTSGLAVPPDWVPAEPDSVADSPSYLTASEAPASSSANVSTSAGNFENTGGDTCADAAIIELPVGPPGSPIGIAILGDSGTATGPECNPVLTTSWWEAFRIDTCATVTIHFCDSPPRPNGTQTRLFRECDPDGSTCGTSIIASAFSGDSCGQTGKGGLTVNDWVQFTQVPAGTYYYPVRASDTPMPGGSPYVLSISAEACEGNCGDCFSACCDAANRDCQDGVLPTDCSGPDQEWHFRTKCCTLECRPPGEMFDSQNVDLMSWITIEEFPSPAHSANEIWGYVSPSGREYAIIGFTTGTGFVEVTNPQNPSIIEVIDGGVDRTWRDIDIIGHHAYIVSDGSGVGLQIVDLAEIDSGIVTLVNTTDLGVGYAVAHNIRANPRTGFLYLAIPNLPDRNGITAVDAADPVNPIIAGTWTDSDDSVRCHDLHVTSYTTGQYAGREIAFCFAENDGVKIVDVTDKANMFTLSTLTYPTIRYTHQGWLSQDKRYLFIDDELDERSLAAVSQTTTYVADVRDLENPVLLPSFTSGVCAIDHNLTVKGLHVFEANYASGLQVFDYSDINNVRRVAYFDTHPGHNGFTFEGAWGVFVLPSGTILVSDRSRGLFVLRLSPPAAPTPELIAGQVSIKNRFLSFDTNATVPQAIRVTFVDLPAPHDLLNGQSMWVGPPREVSYAAAIADPIANIPNFWAATLTCTPHYDDWGALGTINVYHENVIPSGTYAIQVVDEACGAGSEINYSPALTITNAMWGDTMGICDGTFCTVPQGSVDVDDVIAIIRAFNNVPGAIDKTRADVEPATPDLRINVSDAIFALTGFAGLGYPFPVTDATPCGE